MSSDRQKDRELEEWITQSLRSVREAALDGLDRKEALRRAGELETRILAGRISPADVELDEDFKEVLYALVYGVLKVPDRTPAQAARRAKAVYEFIAEIRWDDDDLGEKEELLKDCAAAGAGHLPEEIREVGWRRPPEAVGLDPGEISRSANDSAEVENPSEAEVQRIFDRTFPIIRTVLVELYQLAEPEVPRLERELLAWFVRFCRRPGHMPHNPRAVLLAVGSQFVRQCRSFAEGSPESPTEARLDRLLQRVFSELARERATSGGRGSGG